MTLLSQLDLERLSASALWRALDETTRREAVECVYHGSKETAAARAEADRAIAGALRFRIAAVRQLPVTRRIDYMLRSVRPDDDLASTLLMTLHFEKRSSLLEAFLDELGIPHERGLIDANHELGSPDPERLAQAAAGLFERFPEAQVELYLASLLAMDGDVWGGLAEVVRQRADA